MAAISSETFTTIRNYWKSRRTNNQQVNIWLLDDSRIVVKHDYADEVINDLMSYSRTGSPRFIEVAKDDFYSVKNIESFTIFSRTAEKKGIDE